MLWQSLWVFSHTHKMRNTEQYSVITFWSWGLYTHSLIKKERFTYLQTVRCSTLSFGVVTGERSESNIASVRLQCYINRLEKVDLLLYYLTSFITVGNLISFNSVFLLKISLVKVLNHQLSTWVLFSAPYVLIMH